MSEVLAMHSLGNVLISWVDLIDDLSADPPPEFPHEPVLDLFEASFDAPAAYVHPRGAGASAWKTPVFVYNNPLPVPAEDGYLTKWFTRANHLHPLVRWFALSRDPSAISLDRVPRAVVPARPVEELRGDLRPCGSDQQLSVPCSTDGPSRTFVLAQTGRDFTDAQIDLARRIQPLLMLLSRRVDAAQRQAADAAAHRLTPREITVLRATAAGGTAGAIAARLRISPRTVETHLAAIYRKLDVHDRVTAVRRAEQLALITSTPPRTRPPAANVAT
jgi:DNA-binding CsgD family transcriptional regulator